VTERPAPTQAWVIATEPSKAFPLYSRGNVGEVFPNVVSPLNASLFGKTVRDVFLSTYADLGVLTKQELAENNAPVSGFFSGYLYLNLSVGRVIGARTPGVKPSDIDAQMFGTYDAPPYKRRRGDRNVLASVRLLRSVINVIRTPPLRGFEQARRDSDAFIASLPNLTTATDAELLSAIGRFQKPYYDDFCRLSTSSAAASSGRVIVERLLASKRRGDPSSLVNRLTAGTGTIDSAGLAFRLWDLGRIVASDPTLSAAFDHGAGDLVARLRAEPLASTFVAEFDRFLADHGHRSNDEFEMAAPSWASDPRPALAAIERLRLAPDSRSPHAARERMAVDRPAAEREAFERTPRPAHWLLRRGITLAKEGAEARERAKDLFVRDMSAMRLVFGELFRRTKQRSGPAEVRDCFLVTADELADFVRDPTAFAATIAERAEMRDYLQARVPPFWFDGHISDPSTWPLRPTIAETTSVSGMLQGLGVCNGVATGPARVVLDPNDPRGLEPGDVLVAPFTDPAWTPLFLGACAVVVDIGAQMSHAAIIARELGIPAVVSVTGASATIADGTMLRVNGNNGTVEIC
jgi:rifampicin phosphotransferase